MTEEQPCPGRAAGPAAADPHLARLLAGLQEPEAYPHPTRGIHVAQTATSAVFLTGDFVYKVKKPVRYPFLDYSTLEARRRCCEREIELNRRLCPEVYLDVLPVVERDGRLRIGEQDQPGAVEWVVRLRQLPEADMLPARLAAGRVTVAQMEQLADLLADFHARAATGPEIRALGSPEATLRTMEESLATTQERVGPLFPTPHLEAVRGFLRGFLRAGEPLFRRRMEAGRIRDGHGDLRAQNICLHDGIQVFDCIEFNDRFRCEDVASELAYLAMDLDLAGRPDLRHPLVRRYVEASGDEDLLQVLPFFRCLRAHIRGEIALFAAEEGEVPAHERRGHEEMAAAAFDLARSYTRLPATPSLWITVGVSGSGKSVLARELARRLPAVRIASDALRKQLAGVAPTDRLPEEYYRPSWHQRVYAELHRHAAEWLRRGEHVILDATFLQRASRRAAADLAAAAGAEFWVLECRCPDALVRERLVARAEAGSDPSDAGINVYESQLRSLQRVRENATGHVVVETDRPPGELAREALGPWWASRVPAPSE